jgi:hypothetical protein
MAKDQNELSDEQLGQVAGGDGEGGTVTLEIGEPTIIQRGTDDAVSEWNADADPDEKGEVFVAGEKD